MEFRAFRGNKYIELLSTNNKMLVDQWKMHNGVRREYDAESKTYVYNIDGKSPVTEMCLPKDKKQKLDLYYPLLALQLYFPINSNILCDIGITSYNSERKRITLSSIQKSKQSTLLFTVLPLSLKKYKKWINVLVDVEEIVSDVWKNLKLKSIDFLSFSGNFRIKRIFLLSRELITFTDGVFVISYHQLPKQMSLSKNISQQHTYISSSSCLLGEIPIQRNSDDSSISSRNSSRATLNSEKYYEQEDKTSTLLERKKVLGNFMYGESSDNSYFETYKRKLDLNLSMLTFSKEMTNGKELFKDEEISPEPDRESNTCFNKFNKSIMQTNGQHEDTFLTN